MAVVLAIILFLTKRKGVKRGSHGSSHNYDNDNEDQSNSGDSSSISDSGGGDDD